jgi:tetratricopeptide (TPR) repeat protein
VNDILAVQDEIASAVVSAFRERFGIDSTHTGLERSTESSEAYRLYMQGRFWWNRRDADSVAKAIDYFRQATARDPQFALAFCGLADAHSSLAYFGAEDPKPHAEECRRYALRAASLAPESPEVHGSLGLASWMALDYRGCEMHYRKAAELGRRNPAALYYYGSVLGVMGHHDRAIAYFDRALDIEPLLLPARTWRAFVLHLAGRHEDSIRQYRQALEIDSNLFRARVEGAFPFLALHRWLEGFDTLECAESVYGEHPRILALRGYIWGATGDRSRAMNVIEQLQNMEQRRFVSGFEHALVWLGLGELDKSAGELHRCYQQRYSWVLFARCLPMFRILHGNPGYESLMSMLG